MKKTFEKDSDFSFPTALARELGVKKSTFFTAIKRGYIATRQVYGRTIVSRESAIRWLERTDAPERKRGPKSR